MIRKVRTDTLKALLEAHSLTSQNAAETIERAGDTSDKLNFMQESWAAYAKHAMGFDELAPVSLKGKNSFGSLGAMVIDSLDTLWMFGLREEFQLYVPPTLLIFGLGHITPAD